MEMNDIEIFGKTAERDVFTKLRKIGNSWTESGSMKWANSIFPLSLSATVK
jgi:hypothetical protein